MYPTANYGHPLEPGNHLPTQAVKETGKDCFHTYSGLGCPFAVLEVYSPVEMLGAVKEILDPFSRGQDLPDSFPDPGNTVSYAADPNRFLRDEAGLRIATSRAKFRWCSPGVS